MNREILFRGKRVDTGEWVYGSLLAMNNSLSYGNNEVSSKLHIIRSEDLDVRAFVSGCEVWIDNKIIQIIPSTVGQFTGLTDKNGTKIFEGDIRDFDGGLGQVIWDDAAFAIKSPGSEAVDWEHSSVFINSTLLTTIHDNPTP